MENIEEITAECDAKRVDTFLAEKFGQSRSYFSSLISEGYVIIDGKTPKKSDSLKKGSLIKITFPEEKTYDLTPKKISFEIVLDTKRYAVINKPAGITVHPAPGNYDNSLVNGLLYEFNIEKDDSDFRPGIVHRLDKDTSGLLIIAKDRQAREVLSSLFQNRNINKYYYAIAYGKPAFKEIIIDKAIGRDKFNRQRMSVSDSGKPAKTLIMVKELYSGAFLADVKLFTGRTHQIRVHMKYIKHPLLGDQLYGGNCAKLFHRQALHAYKLEFTDPFTNESISLSIDMPEDMKNLAQKLRK